MYSCAEQQAKMSGDSAKARRFNRALTTLTDLVKYFYIIFLFTRMHSSKCEAVFVKIANFCQVLTLNIFVQFVAAESKFWKSCRS